MLNIQKQMNFTNSMVNDIISIISNLNPDILLLYTYQILVYVYFFFWTNWDLSEYDIAD